jgi:SET domain
MTFRELSQWYGCDDDATFQHGSTYEGASTAQRRPIHNASTWYYLRGVYNAVIRRSLCKDENDPARWDGNQTTDAPHCYVNGVDTGPIEWRLPSTPVDGSGFFVPVAVQYSPGKGRGVFATEPIRKGQTVWVSWYEGWMLSGLLYRQLLDALPTNALKCDLMAFTYFTATDGGSSARVGDDVALYYEGEGYEGYEDAADGDAEVDEGEVDEEEGDGEGEEEEYDADSSLADVSALGFHSSEVPAQDGDEKDDPSNSSDPSKVTERGRPGGAIYGEAQISTVMDGSGERKTRNSLAAASDSETRTRMIIIALDEAAVMNADWDSADGARSNVNVGPREECCDDDDDDDDDVLEGIGGLAHYVAFRDIQAGEEIICDYHNFALDDEGWSRFGL